MQFCYLLLHFDIVVVVSWWLFVYFCFLFVFFCPFFWREREGVNGVTRIFWLISLHNPGAKALYFSEPSFVG